MDIRDIRKLGKTPAELPLIVVHSEGWKNEPRVDGKNRIHMKRADFDWLRQQAPVERVRRIGPHEEEFRFALEAHHLEGGVGDARPAETRLERRRRIRAQFGFDPITGARKKPLILFPDD